MHLPRPVKGTACGTQKGYNKVGRRPLTEGIGLLHNVGTFAGGRE